MKAVYLMYGCDVWKTHSSKNLLGVYTNIKKMKKDIIDLIESGEIGDMDSDGFQLSDIDLMDITDINSRISYVHIDDFENIDLNKVIG